MQTFTGQFYVNKKTLHLGSQILFLGWLKHQKGLMSPWSCCFFNYINVEKICSMCQNWSIYSEATDGYIFYSADEAKYITF